MSKQVIVAALVLFVATTCAFAEPANVIRGDGTCSVGWFGCPATAGIILPDGSWTCPPPIGLVFIEADSMRVIANSEHENLNGRCATTIEFNQPNPGGGLGGGVEVIAVAFETVCAFLPDACQGGGALVINPRTVGELAVCGTVNGPTTRMQETVTRSGNASLVCSLPDPPQGE